MQTGEEKIGFDIECPECNYRFTLVESGEKPPEETIARKPEVPAASTAAPQAEPSTRHRLTQADLQPTPARNQPTPPPSAMPGAIPAIYQGRAGGEWHCRYCSTRQAPMWKSEVSTIGWIVFAILLVTTCLLCWVGLLIRDKYQVCSVCKVRLPIHPR